MFSDRFHYLRISLRLLPVFGAAEPAEFLTPSSFPMLSLLLSPSVIVRAEALYCGAIWGARGSCREFLPFLPFSVTWDHSFASKLSILFHNVISLVEFGASDCYPATVAQLNGSTVAAQRNRHPTATAVQTDTSALIFINSFVRLRC